MAPNDLGSLFRGKLRVIGILGKCPVNKLVTLCEPRVALLIAFDWSKYRPIRFVLHELLVHFVPGFFDGLANFTELALLLGCEFFIPLDAVLFGVIQRRIFGIQESKDFFAVSHDVVRKRSEGFVGNSPRSTKRHINNFSKVLD